MTLTNRRLVGNLGESYTCNFLLGQGYTILDRNYLKKFGELDIVAKKNDIIHFIEVKTITSNFYFNGTNWYKPEDNVHKYKVIRLRRIIQAYLNEKYGDLDREWEFSVITIVLRRKTKELYKIEHLENLIL